MVFSWLDSRAAVAYANATASEIKSLIPPSDHQPTRKEVAKRARKLERVVLSAKEFSTKNRLNFYKKARLANTLRWNLLDAGYSRDFVRELVGLVVANL
jgi:hypothetical protein